MNFPSARIRGCFTASLTSILLFGGAAFLHADPPAAQLAPGSELAATNWQTWEGQQAALHGAVADPFTGTPPGKPDPTIGITPDKDGVQVIARVHELQSGMIRNGVTENYAEHDPVLNAWIDSGVPVHPVISPRWECPRGTFNIANDQMSEWYANWDSWCHAIFTHYKGRVFYYILDNEPDLKGNWGAVYTPAQAVQFTRIAYLEAKNVDPRIEIESPPTSSPETPYLQQMMQLGLANYCDTIGIHIYGAQIDDNRFDTPWKYEAEAGIYKPISASEAGMAVAWAANGHHEPQIWRGNWQQLYLSQLKRYGVASTVLFSLFGAYDGDFSYVNPTSDTPVQPIFDDVKYGARMIPFANGGFERPNKYQMDWAVIYSADMDAAPAGVTFVHGDPSGAHSGSGYLKIDSGASPTPAIVQRVAGGLKPGYLYHLSGWACTHAGSTARLSSLGYDITSGASGAAAALDTNGVWKKLTVSFVPTATWAVVRLEGFGGGVVKWDDVSLSTPAPAPKPAAPTNLTAFPTDRLVSLHWTPVPNASAYNIYRAANSAGPYVLVHTHIIGDPFTDWGVANGKQYFYRIAAVNATTVGQRSSPVVATPNNRRPQDAMKP